MSGKARVTLLHPPNLFGSERYSLTIEIVNTSSNPLTDINVNGVLIPGKNLSYQESKKFKESSKNEIEINDLLEEINLQVDEAYKIQNPDFDKNSTSDSVQMVGRLKMSNIVMRIQRKTDQDNNISILKKIIRFLKSDIVIEELDFSPFFYWESDSAYMRRLASKMPKIPIWAKTATRIDTWEDLESVQELIMNKLPEDSFLKKAFFINKVKLKKLEGNRLPDQRDGDSNIFRSVKLLSGQEVSVTFHCKAPNLLFEKLYDCQFEISYIENESKVLDDQTVINAIAGTQSLRETLNFHPSSYAIPLGTFLGGLSGFLVKYFLLPNDNLTDFSPNKFWLPLVGAIVLALIFASLISKHDDAKKKFITVEDFSGGFFIGALAGLFSEQIIEYLRTLVPSSKTK